MYKIIEERTVYVVNGNTFNTYEDAMNSILPTMAQFIKRLHSQGVSRLDLVKGIRNSDSDGLIGLREAKDYVENIIGS